MVSNYYIDNVLKSFKNFKGTFSSNNTPLLERNESAICNLSKVGEEGSHFICIINKDDTIYFFDSLNLPFMPQDITDNLKYYSNTCNISKQIQHYTSSFCGFYCILMFLACNINIDFFINDILKNFPKCRIENDNLCIELIQTLFPISLKFDRNK
jgi:hypothetical protein